MSDVADEAKKIDLKNRVTLFNDELKALLSKYKLAISATAFLTPDGRVATSPIITEDTGDKKGEENKESDKVVAA
jgi:hypothetical protein